MRGHDEATQGVDICLPGRMSTQFTSPAGKQAVAGDRPLFQGNRTSIPRCGNGASASRPALPSVTLRA
ncbi:hypothetical protein BN2497_12709 [Janthinobacterium sp. CG23_2]|nr:hypothetical protein BN2497_12709 [Janthinobacterium sp. CG23_2]CUU32752.1 hypothetical protein BN3177_12709 [Janthinobacterium sp. CG23_2]